jgi:hypothetical protein
LSLDERWEHRLENWAIWYVSRGGGRSAGVSSAYSGNEGGRGYGDDTVVSAMVGEALDTDGLVAKLERSLQDAIRAKYLHTGTDAMKAADLGIHRDTLADRVKRAKLKLDDLYRSRRYKKVPA